MSKANDLARLLNASGELQAADIEDGVITAAKLASTLDLSGKTVTLPSGTGGKVLQVVNGKYAHASTTSTTPVAGPHDLSITAIGTNSKFVIWMGYNTQMIPNSGARAIVSLRSSVDSYASTLAQATHIRTSTNWANYGGFLTSLHSPNVSSGTTITYKSYFYSHDGTTVYISDTWTAGDTPATMTVMEIAA